MSNAGHVLIIGGTASMASGLIQCARGSNFAVTATSRHPTTSSGSDGVRWLQLDLADSNSIQNLDISGVSHSILLAGITSIGQCERDPAGAYRVNVYGLGLLAARLFDSGVRVLTLSTSQVFSRYVDAPLPLDRRNPTCVYGYQKATLEDVILSNQLGTVVRLTKVLPQEPPLIAGWLDRLSRGETIRAFDNVAVAPIGMHFATAAVWEFLRSESTSQVIHISSYDQMSYAEFVEMIRVRAGLAGSVQPVLATQRLKDGVVVGPFARLGATEDAVTFPGSKGLVYDLANTFGDRFSSLHDAKRP